MTIFTVTTRADENDADATASAPGGTGLSLREAITLANLSAGPDTIVFSGDGVGLIRLTEGQLSVTDELTIDGGGAVTITGDVDGNDVTVTGGVTDIAATLFNDTTSLDDNSPIFVSDADLTVLGLTLTGADFLGAILAVDGNDVTIQDSILAGNRSTVLGGAVSTDTGDVTISNSTISGNSTSGVNRGGGGVSAGGNATITDSTFSGNSTTNLNASGGGVFAGFAATITNSTISGNSTAGDNAEGGGVYTGRDLTVTNSTISGNSTAGTNSNGGGLYADGQLRVTDSIVLGNIAEQSNFDELAESYDSGALISVNGANIIGADSGAFNIGSGIDGSSSTGTAQNAAAADVFRDTEDNNGVTTGVLADNGGGVQTIALLASAASPAVDTAGAGAIAGDARGISGLGARDLGAYETVSDAHLIVTTLADVVDVDDGVVSLREAVFAANGRDGADMITFAASVQGLIRLTEGQIAITDDLIIDGGGAVAITGDAGDNDTTTTGDITDVAGSLANNANSLDDNTRIFFANADVTVSDLTLTGGVVQFGETGGARFASGAAIFANEGADITVLDSTLSGNTAANYGGAVYSYFGDVTVVDSTISGNSTADGFGGGIYANGVITITDSTISENSTLGNGAFGGGVLAQGAVVISDSTISGNSTAGEQASGGGIFSYDAVTVTNSTISGNSATGESAEGGGIYSRGLLTITNSTVSGNSAGNSGGGVFADESVGGGVVVTNSTISGNSTTVEGAEGGGVYSEGTVTVTNSTISGNSTAGVEARGGGIYAYGVTVTNSTISGNSTTGTNADGGGVHSRGDAGVTIENSILLGNIATNGAGNELFEYEQFNTPNRLITVVGTNIIGADPTAFNTTTGVDGSSTGTAQNADPTLVFGATEDNNGVAAGVLTDNGGDVQTIALRADAANPALDAANIAGVDARGSARGVDLMGVANGGTSDLGAFELQINEGNASSTAGDDTLLGTALNDTINALAGNDNVNGLAGDDLLLGGGGNDSIKGAAGDDRLRGNGGEDTLKGGGGDDNLKGNGGEDVIRGNGGDDVIRAGGGADNVKGGGGADLIFGGGGADQLNGGGGADTIRGNGGDDTLKGNGGADVFQFRASDRNDTISDFRQGLDKIQIQSGAQSFEALSIEQDGRDVLIGFGAGQVRVVTDNAGAFDESDFIF